MHDTDTRLIPGPQPKHSRRRDDQTPRGVSSVRLSTQRDRRARDGSGRPTGYLPVPDEIAAAKLQILRERFGTFAAPPNPPLRLDQSGACPRIGTRSGRQTETAS
jgi:hypothetical protein